MELIGAKPERKVVAYFLAAILIGTIILLMPISSRSTEITFVNALFTATSAVCVTGLTVLDTGRDFSFFGQIVILLLIQLGGLGIMTLATALLMTFGPKLSFQDRLVVSQTFDTGRRLVTRPLLKAVVVTTLLFESIGAIMLFAGFQNQYPFGEAVYLSIFHSISAFCNAGFSPLNGGLEQFQSNMWMISVFSFLIISGGLGFAVIRELAERSSVKKMRLSLHSKLCLSTTAILLVLGTVGFLFAEYQNAYSDLGLGPSMANAFFQSVTCRTAGFNTISQRSLTEVSLLLSMILMFIGACPGSTGGGIKTTTLAVVGLLGWHRFRGRRTVYAFKRSISADSVSRALTVLLVAVVILVVMAGLLMFAEEQPVAHTASHGWFADNLFEVVSAFGTVGLSLGVTPHLHGFGKIILVVLMFTGRVGLLTLAFALAHKPRPGEIEYLDEPVMVG